jgi:hypothetical protein
MKNPIYSKWLENDHRESNIILDVRVEHKYNFRKSSEKFHSEVTDFGGRRRHQLCRLMLVDAAVSSRK